MIGRRTVLRSALAMMAGAPAISFGQAYPNHAIRMVNPYAAGGALDIVTRMLAQRMQLLFGQPVVVENKTGAGGNIGADYVAKSAPDGYTLVMISSATHGANAALYGSQMPFDPIKDFETVCIVGTWVNVLVVPQSSPVRSLADLVALAKSKPGKLTFGSSALGGSQHIAGELFKREAGIDMVHVPYKGGAPAMQDLLGGQIDMIFNDMPGALPLVRDGKLRALGVTTAVRSEVMPDVPTIAEQGYPGFDLKAFIGVGAPAGTPADVVAKLNAAIVEVMKQSDVRQRLLGMGIDPKALNVADSRKFQLAEFKRWADVVRATGVKLQQ